jgi:hypothetical protein
MSDNTPIQINFKTKKDGMLINLRANDGAELDLLMTQISERLAVKNAFPTAQVVGSAPTTTPSAGTPECACGGGAMRFVPAGIAKSTGRPYKAFYACPKPQGQACQNKVPA